MEKIIIRTIENDEDGMTIHDIMRQHLLISSRLMTKMKQNYQGILLNGVHANVTKKVAKTDVLTLTIETMEEKAETIVPTHHPLHIVFEDEDLIVVDKQPFIPVHPSQGNYENTLCNYLAYYFQEKHQHFTPRITNRLDKNTSGLVLIAKNSLCAHLLGLLTLQNQIKKEYTAVVCGIPLVKNGEINAPIMRKDGSTIERMVGEGGKTAITRYEVMQTNEKNNCALLKISTLTGRTHQIRVHMAYIGHSLVGDFLYGEENHTLILRHALHMGTLSFTHPFTGAHLTFSCPLPQDMTHLLEERN